MNIVTRPILRFDTVESSECIDSGELIKLVSAVKDSSASKQRLFICIEHETAELLHKVSSRLVERLEAASHKVSIHNMANVKMELLFLQLDEREPLRACFLMGKLFNPGYQRKMAQKGVVIGGFNKKRHMNLIIV